jgi:hypothetical protein
MHCSTFQWRPIENWQLKNMLLHMSATTLSIMTLIIITFSIMSLRITMNKMWHSAQPHSAYCTALLSSLEQCQLCSMLCWVSHTSPLCWVSLYWMSLWWMSLFWVSLCWMLWCLHVYNGKKNYAKIWTLILLTAYTLPYQLTRKHRDHSTKR